MTPENEILSSRVLQAPVEKVFAAFANPTHLQNWCGPEGFTNTIHVFDLRAGGAWRLTMHGPEVGHYENASVFEVLEPMKRIKWKRESKPLFEMEVTFEALTPATTRISFRMIFATAEECAKIRNFAEPKNEENFDRLVRELGNVRV